MAKNRRRQAKLTYPQEYYIPELLRQGILSEAEIRKEYSRLRSIARKRLKTFEGTRFENYQSYQLNKNKFKPLAQIRTKRELIFLLSDVEKFISAKSSTVTGLREIEKTTLHSLQSAGYEVTEKNIASFGEFMEEFRSRNLNAIYDSDEAYETWKVLNGRKLETTDIMDNFEMFVENREAVSELPKFRNPEKRTAAYYRQRLEL